MSNAEHPPSHRASTLRQWVAQLLEPHGMQFKLRLRGNTLHLLCQASPCPDRLLTLLWLLPQLQQTNLNSLIPVDQPPVYQLQLYGSLPHAPRPDWTASVYLNQLDRHLENVKHRVRQSDPALIHDGEQAEAVLPSASSALALSNRNLAQQGQETAIASYLSEALSDLGVGVRVSAKTIAYRPPAAVQLSVVPPSAMTTKRLWVACEAAYSPDPALVSEPITRRLRDLEIAGYRDAVILFQVAGEAQPDWKLRVDLTPPSDMLKEWARWGDVEAIRRFLNQTGEPQNLQITTASLKESTLHLFCSTFSVPHPEIPNQAQARHWVIELLEMLAPQGIQAVALYGHVAQGTSQTTDLPAWVEWVQLPAAVHPALSESALDLAQQGDWEAIAFLLHRLLNANLEEYLRTGGIRLQLLPKQDLLHVMSEAVICPEQRQVGPTIAKFLRQLKLSHLAGVRIYGRRAGQKLPLWSYGVDFATRDRLVPEATPEFAATDALVGDLIPTADEPVLRPDLTSADVQAVWQRWQQRVVHGLEQTLVRSHLFVPNPGTQALVTTTAEQNGYRDRYQSMKLAAVWGAVGILLTLQTNWLVSQALRNLTPSEAKTAQTAPTPAEPTDLSAPVLSSTLPPDLPAPAVFQPPPSPEAKTDEPQIFNSEGFTRREGTDQQAEPAVDRATPLPSPAANPAAVGASAPVALPYTPTTPAETQITAEILAESSLPSFNSHQFDDKLKLYYRFLEENGKPPDILVLGSSRALRGIDPVALKQAIAELGYTDVTIFNFGINGATAQVADLVLQQMLTPDQLPRLILWADGARAFNSGATDVTYNGIVASEGYQQLLAGTFPIPHAADQAAPQRVASGLNTTLTSSYESLDRWLSNQLAQLSGTYEERDRLKHSLQQGFTQLVPLPAEAVPGNNQPLATPSAAQPLVNPDGFLSLAAQFNPATYYQKYARVIGQYDSDYEDFQIAGRQAAALQSLLQYTQSHNVPVVFVNLPLTEDYLDPFRRQHEQTFKDFMVELSLQQPSLTFRDLGDLWTTQYSYFSDPSHLNRYGAYAVSERLAQDPLIPWAGKKPKQ
ncbi:DUF1574 domain-containing protein [Phormidium tenue FACHB-886]|nr:DUF1574 domain-containing protein [Phormidium tenue FACHB-886]